MNIRLLTELNITSYDLHFALVIFLLYVLITINYFHAEGMYLLKPPNKKNDLLAFIISLPGALYAGFAVLYSSIGEKYFLSPGEILPGYMMIHLLVLFLITMAMPMLMLGTRLRSAIISAFTIFFPFAVVSFIVGIAFLAGMMFSSEIATLEL